MIELDGSSEAQSDDGMIMRTGMRPKQPSIKVMTMLEIGMA